MPHTYMGDNPNQMQVGRRSGVCKEFASSSTTTTKTTTNNKRNLDGMHPKQNADLRACGRRERRRIGGIGDKLGRESQQRASEQAGERERERDVEAMCARRQTAVRPAGNPNSCTVDYINIVRYSGLLIPLLHTSLPLPFNTNYLPTYLPTQMLCPWTYLPTYLPTIIFYE